MKNNHTSHMWLMALACGGALLLILVLPLFGLSGSWSAGIAIAVMIILHAWMMKGHAHNHSDHIIKKGSKKIYFC